MMQGMYRAILWWG